MPGNTQSWYQLWEGLRVAYLATQPNDGHPAIVTHKQDLGAVAALPVAAVPAFRDGEERHAVACGLLFFGRLGKLGTALLGSHDFHAPHGLRIVLEREVESLAQRIIRDV